MLTMCVMVCRQAVMISFNVSVLIWSSLQFLFFLPIISLLTSSCVSGPKLVSFGVFVSSLGWYCEVPVKDCHILVILLEKNSAKPSAISLLVLPGGSGLWVLHPVSLFTILKSCLVSLLLSIICFVIICLLWNFNSLLYRFLSMVYALQWSFPPCSFVDSIPVCNNSLLFTDILVEPRFLWPVCIFFLFWGATLSSILFSSSWNWAHACSRLILSSMSGAL